ncbi:Zn-dependent hydrolase [bacterium]|nr:MAG: Zn-dependent hydrolase [bacterium]
MTALTISLERMLADIEALGRVGVDPRGGLSRLGISPQEQLAHEWFKQQASQVGMTLRGDAAANLYARREGSEPGLAPLMAGSHLDTVPNGGKYDGAAGVVIALEMARTIRDFGVRLRHPFEVIVFRAEEPSPFGMSTFGSRVLAGRLRPEELDAVDSKGRSLRDALRTIGGDPEELEGARMSAGDVAAYLEVHNEQGPHLERAGLPLAVVTEIAGIKRGRWRVIGEPNHSGSTSMDERRDALMAASEIALELERLARSYDGAVGTIGVLTVEPNAVNIVPGCVDLRWEIRSCFVRDLQELEDAFEHAAHAILERRGLRLEELTRSNSVPVAADRAVLEAFEEACAARNLTAPRLRSMAGHDASHMAAFTRIGMLFIRSTGGKSHVPEEHSPPESLAVAATIMLDALMRLDRDLD